VSSPLINNKGQLGTARIVGPISNFTTNAAKLGTASLSAQRKIPLLFSKERNRPCEGKRRSRRGRPSSRSAPAEFGLTTVHHLNERGLVLMAEQTPADDALAALSSQADARALKRAARCPVQSR
jgi:hypothetical protein